MRSTEFTKSSPGWLVRRRATSSCNASAIVTFCCLVNIHRHYVTLWLWPLTIELARVSPCEHTYVHVHITKRLWEYYNSADAYIVITGSNRLQTRDK